MTRYFKIRIGYGQGDDHFIRINENELEMAYFIFLNPDARAIFKDGPVRGKDIISIDEDWHRAMGWNYDYPMGPDDWAQARRELGSSYTGYKNLIKEKVEFMIKQGLERQIGKNVEVIGFEVQKALMPPEIAGQVSALAASKKI